MQVFFYIFSSIVYNLFLHPLRKYPGPRLWAISQIPFSLTWMSGAGHKKMLELHQKYGDVVRITPNQLSFGYPEAWDEIMGHRKRDQDENGKDPDFWDDQDKLTLVGSNRERHRRLRKILSHGFSAQAMVAQQATFQRYASLLIERLKAASDGGQAVEMTQWYNWTTFDIAGDLIFGEPFGCLDNLDHHPWVKLIFEHIRGIAISTAVIRFPFGRRLIKAITPRSVARDIKTHNEFTKAQVDKRFALQDARPDLMESIIKARAEEQASDGEVLANAHNLIVGGSETTATTLAGTTYLLATNRSVLAKLHEEIKTTFRTEDEIDLISVHRLEYMLAVFDEALRIYPPVPSAIPRKAPPNGTTIGGRYVPPNTILGIWQWPMFHNPKFFRNPESFVPERWLGDPRFDGDRKKVFQPFSVGPRDCIGKNLAYAEMRLILAKMVWNFDIELDPRSENWLEKNMLYFLWEKPELYVRLTPRTVE
ncbi:cytochrome P450 [Lepidopterella palustris CBS 459.81]|uniref:Cytochrome P450 n=1 Tax=Lepidopterella palustris CBS 459.81 TaxID=1314670 RepID=A0A8E2J9Q3_9PEZI|nr:cytochrome P450 [Lepidopterella palustris CBS 459.81]